METNKLLTQKLLTQIEQRDKLVSHAFLLSGKDWKEIKDSFEWTGWNGEKTTWANFLAQYGNSVWSVDRAINCYEYFVEKLGMSFEQIFQDKTVSSKNLCPSLGLENISRRPTGLLLTP